MVSMGAPVVSPVCSPSLPSLIGSSCYVLVGGVDVGGGATERKKTIPFIRVSAFAPNAEIQKQSRTRKYRPRCRPPIL